MPRLLSCVSLLVVGAACATPKLPPHDPAGGDPTRLVVDARAAAESSLRNEEIVVPFGQRESGTRLVLALMELARARGAFWVADLEFLHVFRWKGELVECATRVALAEEATAPPAAPTPPVAAPAATPSGEGGEEMPTYESLVAAPQPQRVGVRLSEDVVRCEKVGQGEIVTRPVHVNHLDVEVARLIEGPMPLYKDLVIHWRDRCRMEHVTHDVERWDFQVRLEWTPPDWALISRSWSTERLGDGPPRCYRTTLAEVGEPPRHRMRARLYYRSSYRDSGVTPPPPTGTPTGFMDDRPL